MVSIGTALLLLISISFLWLVYWMVVPNLRFLSFYRKQKSIWVQPFIPVIGHLKVLQEFEQAKNQPAWLRMMQEKLGLITCTIYGPAMRLLCINDVTALRSIFTSQAHLYLKSHPSDKELMCQLLKNGLLMSEGEHWKQQRTLLNAGFHWAYLRELVPLMIVAANACVDRWSHMLDRAVDANVGSRVAHRFYDKRDHLDDAKHAASRVGHVVENGGDSCVEVEIANDMASFTLDTIATAAFGSSFSGNHELSQRFIKLQKRALEIVQLRTLTFLGYIPFLKDLPIAGKTELVQCSFLYLRVVISGIHSFDLFDSHRLQRGRQDLQGRC